MRRAAVALVHHPVLDRAGEVFTTTLTNLDLHDIARCARTYELEAFYVVHPFASQRAIATRMRDHWMVGPGGRRIPDRAEALGVVRVVEDVAAAERDLAGPDGAVERWTTAARAHGAITPWAEARAALAEDGAPVLLCFGTGWGLAPTFLVEAARRLPPIAGRGDFNHLSVRAACAITLDRLWGSEGG